MRVDACILLVAWLLTALTACLACGQDDPRAPQDSSVTDHAILLGGTTIRYEATAGYTPIRGPADRASSYPLAAI